MTRYLGIDVGRVRIGLAVGEPPAAARALATVDLDGLAAALAAQEPLAAVVVGLPRGLDGQDTAQTLAVRRWADDHLGAYADRLVWQDEAATSSLAEDELRDAGKPYTKADIDARAAAIILQDYLDSL